MSKPIDLEEIEEKLIKLSNPFSWTKNDIFEEKCNLEEQARVASEQVNDLINEIKEDIASLLKDVEREVNAVELSRRITEVQKDIDDIGGGNFLKFVNKEYIVANEFNPQSSNYDWVDVEYVDQWSQGDSGDSFSGYLYVWLYDDVFGVWEYSTY